MPFELDFGTQVPMGFAAESVPSTATSARVELCGFYSSEDGLALTTRLDGISNAFLSRLPADKSLREAQIEQLVIVLRRTGKATLYVNELSLVGQIRSKRSMNAGELVRKDDIADICRAEFEGFTIPADAAVIMVLSFGWQRALYFDYLPIAPGSVGPRTFDMPAWLAQIVTYLVFQERLRIGDAQWEEMFRQRWFPFVAHTTDELKSLLVHADTKAPIDTLIPAMAASAKTRCQSLLERIDSHSALREHRALLRRGIEHFERGDDVSSVHILFSRIEGILRVKHRAAQMSKASQAQLATAAIVDLEGTRHSLSLLLPQRFKRFLETVYFSSFDPEHVDTLSRNSVNHGVAPESLFSPKGALMGVMILEQILWLWPSNEAKENASSDVSR